MTPLFIFSLPRSGSTLTQKILGTHPEITTVGEPWILLPYLYTLKEQGAYAEYGHHLAAQAIEQFCLELPNGKADYQAEIRALVLRLYDKVARNNQAASTPAKYFLDKTPRYALVAEEIIQLFPEAKFILLWRNPLAIAASMMTTWSNNKWNLYRYRIDLFDGLANLVSIAEKYSDRLHILQYENLLLNPQVELQKICDYLDISFNQELLSRFSQTKLNPEIGDPTGINQYQRISREPLEKWKSILANPLRKTWSKKYLKWLGQDRLGLMGYDQNQLLDEIKQIPLNLQTLPFDLHRILRKTWKSPQEAWQIYNSLVVKD